MADPRIPKLFKFLRENRHYPLQVQLGYRRATLLPFNSVEDRAYALLHSCYYTQRSAKLDTAKSFFKDLADKPQALTSFNTFAAFLDTTNSYEAVYEKLIKKDGWGPKTVALFLKNIYQLRHIDVEQNSPLCFWKDAPPLAKKDRIYLPVDAVILKIFEDAPIAKKSFIGINHYLYSLNYCGADLEVWDDLWFWGFLTQRIKNGQRHFVCFNEGKYRSILHVPKDQSSNQVVRSKCKEFLSILNDSKPCEEENHELVEKGPQ